jgi:uncharacterized membrane protein
MKLPYRINRWFEAVIWAMLGANALASFWFYSRFPSRVPTHWNAAGVADGFSGPAFAAFFFPALIILLYLMLVFLPAADPQKSRYKEFSRPYQAIRFILVGYLSLLYYTSSLIGLGYQISINKVMVIAIGLLFLVLGNFMPKVRKNWFVGIRTPWTLSDERVWNKTHRLAGKLFALGGLLSILTVLLDGEKAFTALMVIIFGVVLGSVTYSWLAWKRLQ